MTSSLGDRDAARLDDDGAPVPAARDSAAADARLVWTTGRGASPPSGVWSPQSRDAVAAITELLPEISTRLGGPVTRMSLNIDAWNGDQPRRLRIGDRLVRLGWFRTLDPATVTLARGGGTRVTLRVVAPEVDPGAARASR